MTENYKGTINVAFDQMPQIKLVSFLTKNNAGFLQKLATVTKRRRFTLVEDWKLELGNVRYKHGLNGSILIPKNDKSGNPIIFDGASIPLPWLISLLTIGILRPLGVTLIGSVVHDYAYKFGELIVIDDKETQQTVPLARHQADKLFRDIIGTINQLRPIGYIAWLAVRVGWIIVPYAGRHHTGRKPIPEYSFVLLVCLAIYWIVTAGHGFFLLYFILACLVGLYLLSIFSQTKYDSN